ncbi:hypothetical protein CEXT_581801 [Caerostris extrusa]|uniref:Secreted protein n=1 Tax=Caerostris extrusa TaxID=172846 RepID=A0AAV4R714_CAEEX|nr:hypothetical protein CEXT_581801 [Caerostris extrusa]
MLAVAFLLLFSLLLFYLQRQKPWKKNPPATGEKLILHASKFCAVQRSPALALSSTGIRRRARINYPAPLSPGRFLLLHKKDCDSSHSSTVGFPAFEGLTVSLPM